MQDKVVWRCLNCLSNKALCTLKLIIAIKKLRTMTKKIIDSAIRCLLLLGFVFVCGCSKSKIYTTENLANITLKSTVAITMQDKDRQIYTLGSGAIIDNGVVVTNLHVIAGAPFGFIQLPNDPQKYNIEGYLAFDKENDIALIYVPSIQGKSFKLQTNLPKVGGKIYAAGNPHGLAGTFSEGNVSAIRVIENKNMIQITAPISPGSSGGPIVNSNAELLGIAVGCISDGQNLNFAIPASYIVTLLKIKSEPRKLDLLRENKSNSNSKDSMLTNGLIVRKIKWGIEFIDDGFGISEISIYNKLNVRVSNIKMIFILYDNGGIPIDYDTLTLLPDNEIGIEPGLAQIFRIAYKPPTYNYVAKSKYELKLVSHKGDSCVYRILDFTIIN